MFYHPLQFLNVSQTQREYEPPEGARTVTQALQTHGTLSGFCHKNV